jgi:hypothetical protein
MDRLQQRQGALEPSDKGGICQVPARGNHGAAVVAAGADHIFCRVEITGKPAFSIHPHAEKQRRQIVNRFAAIPAEGGAAHADHAALARLSSCLP